MTQKNFTSLNLKNAIGIFSLMLLSLALIFSSFTTHKMTEDVWKMLGITKQSGDEKIKSSFINGYLSYYGVKNLRHIALNDRASLTKDLLTYTKQFVSSPAFTKEYEELRKSAKPEEPKLKPLRTIEEIQKEEIAKMEKS